MTKEIAEHSVEHKESFWNFIFNYLVAFGGVVVYLLNIV